MRNKPLRKTRKKILRDTLLEFETNKDLTVELYKFKNKYIIEINNPTRRVKNKKVYQSVNESKSIETFHSICKHLSKT
jgi:hypothetical protein